MSNDLSLIRARILSELLSTVQQNEITRELDLGKFVLFIESELLRNLEDRILNLKLLWTFCEENTDWSRDFFIGVFEPLKDKLASLQVIVVLPRPVRGSHTSSMLSLRPEVLELLQKLIVVFMDCIITSPLRDQVGVESIDGLLIDSVADFEKARIIDLDPVWERLSKLPGVSPEKAESVFLQIKEKEAEFGLEVMLPEYILKKNDESVDLNALTQQLSNQPGMTEDMISVVVGSIKEKEHKTLEIRASKRLASRADLQPIDADALAAFDLKKQEALLELVLACVKETPIERIIDPEKLRDFLAGELLQMWNGSSVNLKLLWEILEEAPGVSEDMLVKVFVMLEAKQDELDIPLQFPPQIQSMSSAAKNQVFPSGFATGSSKGLSSGGAGLTRSPSKENYAANLRIDSPYKRSPSRATSSQRSVREQPQGGRGGQSKYGRDNSPKKKPERKKTKHAYGKKVNPQTNNVARYATVIGLLLLSYFAYSAWTSEGRPKYRGTPVSHTAYQKIIPIKEMVLSGGQIGVLLAKEAMELQKEERDGKLGELLGAIREKYRAANVTVFDTDKKIIIIFN